ncbi:Modulator of FtsH protease HflK [Tsuneonella dongtanensis]|uniref:Protein HflK n=1 Tax=Tsuneonella dongtanensis TaxID=692370 RepID=A0A1B2A956_9SPHN|nr:FtsH protease activity modulator HflK [Tsuneonella dongtanensis]ANY18690.1 Modulator of FtsH protease HflK [Tsuneonella dongtanensis]
MDMNDGLGRVIGLAMAGKSPWGGGKKPEGEPEVPSTGDDPVQPGKPAADTPADDKPKRKGPRNPWLPVGDEPRRSASIEDIFKHRGPEGPRRTIGGGGGPGFRLPERPGGKSWFPLAIGAIVAVWLGFSMIHQVGPKEEGVVTTFGKYSRTLTPGLNVTFPWPIQNVDIEQVSEFRIEQIPEGTAQKLMLTGDQNLVDLSYIVRWSIKDLKQFRFELADPEATLRDVAEAAMRASVATKQLDDVLSGAGRADIEGSVLTRMQAILDAYQSGIAVQGVQIRKTDPPKEVEEAFKDVSAAQQDADAEINKAELYAQQVLARAQGDAASFDKIYAQYKLAPEVTRRRLYYETMERVLRNNDKTVIEAQGVTPYLPLQEVRKRPAQNEGAQ